MTRAAYEEGIYSWPYIARMASGEGELFYYGARHTYTPTDPQVAEISQLWEAFRPDVAFNEGGNPPVEESMDDAVSKHGEAGLVRYLAARDDVPVASLDPTRAQEVAWLRKFFPADRVKLFFLLRAAAQIWWRGPWCWRPGR